MTKHAVAAGEGEADRQVTPAQGMDGVLQDGADGGHACRLVVRQHLQAVQLQRLGKVEQPQWPRRLRSEGRLPVSRGVPSCERLACSLAL